MSNGIQKYEQQGGQLDIAREKWDVLREMSEQVSKSGLFKMSAPQVLTLMMLAESEGLHPIKALTRYHIIEGKPSMRADTMQAEFQAAGGRVKWLKSDAEECIAEFSHPTYGKEPFSIRLTFKEFYDSGVATCWKDSKREISANWKKFPAAMLRARAVTAGVRAVLPSVIMGVYSEEETADAIDVTPVEQTAHANLTAKLRQNGERVQDRHPPVAETVEELAKASVVDRPSSAWPTERAGKSPARQWIEDQLKAVNEVLAARGATISVHANQVVNHAIKAAVENELVVETDLLMGNGKRSTAAVASEFNRLWNERPDWVKQIAGDYMADQVPDAVDAPAELATS